MVSLKNVENYVVIVVQEMIENKEIYGEYFESTKSLIIEQQGDIKEIDKLLKQFEQWESEEYEKKES